MEYYSTTKKEGNLGNSLAVQWLGLGASMAGGPGSIPGWGTKIPQATWHSQRKKEGNLADYNNMDGSRGHYAR